MDPKGTCHQIGCPGKGEHAPHGIGAGTWEDYALTSHCLGFPQVDPTMDAAGLNAWCSLHGSWSASVDIPLSPQGMAELVDKHKSECPNRKAT